MTYPKPVRVQGQAWRWRRGHTTGRRQWLSPTWLSVIDGLVVGRASYCGVCQAAGT